MTITSKILLSWYQENARILPWRISPKESILGKKPDPYKVWISEIMLQQTTVATVIPYFKSFIRKWNCIEKLSRANESEILGFWAGLGYYARARNLLKCAKVLAVEFDGKIPNDKEKLLGLPGIGEYTASAIRSIAFDEREVVIDGNVERIICRLFKIEKPIKQSKKNIRKYAFQLFPEHKCGDFAQALMDFANLVCKPKKPVCVLCPISRLCQSFKFGVEEVIPKKKIRTTKPVKKGFVFFVRIRPNKFLIERRPSKGILGGLLGFPTTNWDKDLDKPVFPFDADWNYTKKLVTHQFSHFKLQLEIIVGERKNNIFDHSKYQIVDSENFDFQSLPTLMRKIYLKATGI